MTVKEKMLELLAMLDDPAHPILFQEEDRKTVQDLRTLIAKTEEWGSRAEGIYPHPPCVIAIDSWSIEEREKEVRELLWEISDFWKEGHE